MRCCDFYLIEFKSKNENTRVENMSAFLGYIGKTFYRVLIDSTVIYPNNNDATEPNIFNRLSSITSLAQFLFQFFSIKEITPLFLINKKWYSIGNDPVVWKQFSRRFPEFNNYLSCVTSKDQIKLLLRKIKRSYAKEVINIFGGAENILRMPVIQLDIKTWGDEYALNCQSPHVLVDEFKSYPTLCRGIVGGRYWIAIQVDRFNSKINEPSQENKKVLSLKKIPGVYILWNRDSTPGVTILLKNFRYITGHFKDNEVGLVDYEIDKIKQLISGKEFVIFDKICEYKLNYPNGLPFINDVYDKGFLKLRDFKFQ